jgi:hypothetical protein
MYRRSPSEHHGKTTWIHKVGTVIAIIVATSFFWIPAILLAMTDYAIQEDTVVATNKALVKEIHHHNRWEGIPRGTDLGIEYTTNNGERIETHLRAGWGGCRDNDKDDPAYGANPGNNAQVGDALKIKYMSSNFHSAFPADYQPRYNRPMYLAGCVLVIVSIIGWFNVKEWLEQNRKVAVYDTRRQAKADAKAQVNLTPGSRPSARPKPSARPERFLCPRCCSGTLRLAPMSSPGSSWASSSAAARSVRRLPSWLTRSGHDSSAPRQVSSWLAGSRENRSWLNALAGCRACIC